MLALKRTGIKTNKTSSRVPKEPSATQQPGWFSNQGDITLWTTPAFSIELITVPVSGVERTLRFYVNQVGFTLIVDYSPNDAFRVLQLTPPGSSCSIQIGRTHRGARWLTSQRAEQFQFTDTLSWTRGVHAFRFGADVMLPMKLNYLDVPPTRRRTTYDGSYTQFAGG